ncbi:MAG: MFS transporter [Ruminococcaceae bacterium]|nr:MFS transporter [Oscillospiraceae bacterium]
MENAANKFKRTKFACYYSYLACSSVFSLPPLLFVTFHEMYNVSYTLLGTLVLVNFFTQLFIDLVFTFFSKYFNIHKVIRTMPLISAFGMAIYALIPTLFPEFAYAGLFAGTIIFSVASGLGEVLLSPLIAAIPSKTPEKDMSRLHSLYGYGVVSVVIISTVFLKIFGNENWMYLTLFFAALPIGSCILFSLSPLPEMNISSGDANKENNGTGFAIALCVLCIFLGSAAENTMTNWISGFAENALHISKTLGDILGFMVFAILLALCRSVYAKFGGNISTVLLIGMAGATLCYLVAGLSSNPVVSLIACVLTGLATSMLWPGTLILMEEKIPGVGVTAYALMAAGGDFGASVAPQLMGIVVDKVAVSNWANSLSATLNLTPEQIGMKTGMLVAMLFPLFGIALLFFIKKYFKKNRED